MHMQVVVEKNPFCDTYHYFCGDAELLLSLFDADPPRTRVVFISLGVQINATQRSQQLVPYISGLKAWRPLILCTLILAGLFILLHKQ